MEVDRHQMQGTFRDHSKLHVVAFAENLGVEGFTVDLNVNNDTCSLSLWARRDNRANLEHSTVAGQDSEHHAVRAARLPFHNDPGHYKAKLVELKPLVYVFSGLQYKGKGE
ncbi:hypothetical protein KC19_2G192100 [Ceratodon purpureus]|uniref:Uncharacterized protein n=1 Tax=Ceratodon purpureus TaxID=3225 RepID=A0A8T0IX74_CERPU|nr:hypothetical protein KC19_2G192100 [Ceratodon purpureus]